MLAVISVAVRIVRWPITVDNLEIFLAHHGLKLVSQVCHQVNISEPDTSKKKKKNPFVISSTVLFGKLCYISMSSC